MNYSTWMAEEAHGWATSEPSTDSSREAATEDGSSTSSSGNDPEALAAWSLLTDEEREKTTDGSTIVICDDNADLRQCVWLTFGLAEVLLSAALQILRKHPPAALRGHRVL